MHNLLTDRQIQVMECIANGQSIVETADELEISQSTVKQHTSMIFAALNVESRSQVSRIWWQWQIEEIKDNLRRLSTLPEETIQTIFEVKS